MSGDERGVHNNDVETLSLHHNTSYNQHRVQIRLRKFCSCMLSLREMK